MAQEVNKIYDPIYGWIYAAHEESNKGAYIETYYSDDPYKYCGEPALCRWGVSEGTVILNPVKE